MTVEELTHEITLLTRQRNEVQRTASEIQAKVGAMDKEIKRLKKQRSQQVAAKQTLEREHAAV